jgi:hypothetical protein
MIAEHCCGATALCLRGSVFTELLLETGCITPLFYCCVRELLSTAVSVDQQFLRGANTPQYCHCKITSVCLCIYGSTDLLLDLGRFSQLLHLLHSQWDSLDGGTARGLTATYTQNNTNTVYTHIDIHASSGIRSHDPSVWASEDSSCLRPRGHCDRLTSV